MGNVVIIINNQEITDFQPSELGLSTSWESKLIKQLNAFKVKSTKTISLPLSKGLRKAINDPLVLDSVSELNPITKPSIEILVDGEVFISGYIKFGNVTINKIGNYIDCFIEPIERDFWQSAKDLNLRDLDFSSDIHTLDVSNIRASETYSASRPYVYAPIDTGSMGHNSILFCEQVGGTTTIYYSGDEMPTFPTTLEVQMYGNANSKFNTEPLTTIEVTKRTGTFWDTYTNLKACNTTDLETIEDPENQTGYFYGGDLNWQVHDFVPCIRIKDILSKAMSTIGWSISGDWVDDNLTDKYHFIRNKSERTVSMDERFKFAVGLVEGGMTLSSGSVAGSTITFPFTKRTGIEYLPTDNYTDTDSDDVISVNSGTNVSEWVAPENCYMRFDFRILAQGNITGYQLLVYDNVGTTIWQYVSEDSGLSGLNSYDITVNGAYAYVPLGYKVRLRVSFDALTDNPNLLDKSYLRGYPVYKIMPDIKVHLDDFMPNVSFYEWLKDLSQIWQLHFYANESTNELHILSDNEKMNGTVVDWVKKLNRDVSVKKTPVSLSHPNKYIVNYLSDTEDEEMTSREYIAGRFAQGEIQNLNPFSRDTENIDLAIYSASLNGEIEYYNPFALGIPFMRIPEKKRGDFKSRIFKITFGVDTPTQTVEGSPAQMDYTIGASTVTTYPRAEFSDDLHFSELITTHWQRVVAAINYGHILRGSFRLTSKDANKFNTLTTNLNQYRSWHAIQVNGVEVRCELLRVVDFQPTTNDDTICELLWIIKRN